MVGASSGSTILRNSCFPPPLPPHPPPPPPPHHHNHNHNHHHHHHHHHHHYCHRLHFHHHRILTLRFHSDSVGFVTLFLFPECIIYQYVSNISYLQIFPGGLNSLELFRMIYSAVKPQDLCLSHSLAASRHAI